MARKTKEDAEQTRLAILDSALQTFYEKGFARATFDEIAKKINLTKGAVYWHFRNKTDLITALIQQKISDHRRVTPVVSLESLAELRQAIVSRSKNIEHDADYRRFVFFMIYRMEWSEAVLAKVWPEIGELVELPEKILCEALQKMQKQGEIKEDVDIPLLRDVLVSLWKGVLGKYIAGYQAKESFSEMIGKSFDMVINSVKMKKK